jgi:hypothetical protein
MLRRREASGDEVDGKAVWSWRPDAGVKSAMMLRITQVTVAIKPGTPGRARSKPLKPSRRECRLTRRTCGD